MVSLIVHTSIVMAVGLLIMIFPDFFSHIFIVSGVATKKTKGRFAVNRSVSSVFEPETARKIMFFFGLLMFLVGLILFILTILGIISN